ncbi:MAG: hypothetical protein ACRETQ_11765 [Gammaproteobacteria bacterium]
MITPSCLAYGRRALFGALLLLSSGLAAVAWGAACPAPVAAGVEHWPDEAAWRALQADGYRIGAVNIVVDNVFDLSDPAQKKLWYARLADRLHIKTHPSAIREQLLFKPGDPVDTRVIYESVRRLHQLVYLRAARIIPESCAGKQVTARVAVKDAWTLKLDFRFSHVGGQNTTQFNVSDVDFLGSGKKLTVGHTENPQRSGNQILYQDPSLFGSFWQLGAGYQDLSDGHLKSLSVGLPFYEDTTPWSLQTTFYDQKENLNFYNQGALAWVAPSRIHERAVSWAHLLDWSDTSGTRAGVFYTSTDYEYSAPAPEFSSVLPEPVLTPRLLKGAGLSFEFFQDRYADFTNLEYIDRPEDYNLGWVVDAQTGHYGGGFGGSVSAPFYGLSASWGTELPARTLFLASGYVDGREQDGTTRNLLTNFTLTAYSQEFHWQTLVAHLQWDSVLRPDPESYLYIGGLQGLRGYPNYFAIGDRRWQATLADRIVTPWQLWSLFQVGFVGYADWAQIHQISPSAWSPTYSDVGAGLRFGFIRSAFSNTLYFTVAWPLHGGPGVHGHEIVIGNTLNF